MSTRPTKRKKPAPPSSTKDKRVAPPPPSRAAYKTPPWELSSREVPITPVYREEVPRLPPVAPRKSDGNPYRKYLPTLLKGESKLRAFVEVRRLEVCQLLEDEGEGRDITGDR